MKPCLMTLYVDYTFNTLNDRERVALSAEEQVLLYQQAIQLLPVEDFFVLSTCNRTELYFTPFEGAEEKVVALLRLVKNDNTLSADCFRVIKDTTQSCLRLFEVAVGLRSGILGDIQIIHQVKNAYQLACDMDTAGPFLHRLLHSAFFIHKKVASETSFKSGQVSIASVVTDKIRGQLPISKSDHILVLGTGSTGLKVIENIQASGYSNITIANRTLEKASAIALEKGVNVLPFDEALKKAHQYNVIISAVQVGEVLLTAEDLHQQEKTYVFDLSVPRSVDLDAGKVSNVMLWNIDKLQEASSKTLEQRKAAVPDVREIIASHLDELAVWSRQLDMKPVIHQFKTLLNDIRRQEINRHMKKLAPEQVEVLEQITSNIADKILKYPVLHLKQGCLRDEYDTSSIQALRDLFDLEVPVNSIEDNETTLTTY